MNLLTHLNKEPGIGDSCKQKIWNDDQDLKIEQRKKFGLGLWQMKMEKGGPKP